MYKNLLVASALALALTACGSDDKDANPMNDYTAQGQFEPGSNEDFKQNAGDSVYFDTNSSKIGKDGKDTVSKQAEWLKKHADKKVTIEGHCDQRGTAEYNQALGERRANAAEKALAGAGVAKDRLNTISYGKERAAGHTAEEWAKDRRATSVVN
jgi:peptidoglycan-associated lipoprotein